MKAQAQPSGSPAVLQSTQEHRPPSKLGGWAVALIFLALLVVLIVANM